MMGILFAFTASLFLETADVIGKNAVQHHRQSLYQMGFLALFWSTVWFLSVILYKGAFIFSLQSLPFFVPRLILELLLVHVSLRAIIDADRSTHSFARTVTIPVLLLTDVLLGYQPSMYKLIGFACIITAFILIVTKQEVRKKGLMWSIGGALLAVITISLYKYNISTFNAVEAEQFLVTFALLVYFSIGSAIVDKRLPFYLLLKRPFAVQSIFHATASVVNSFAYVFAPASVIMAAGRSSAVLWSVISGKVIFHETHILMKICIVLFIITGIVFIAL